MSHRSKKILSYIITVMVIAVAAAWVFVKFVHLGNVEFTDNAQIQQQIVPVNSRVQGYIKKICFKEFEGQRRSSVARVLTKYPADAVHEERQVRDTVQL